MQATLSAPPDLWPHQQWALAEVPRRIARGERKILLTSPTGAGKSRVICELIRRAAAKDWHCVVYTNRRMLIDQLAGVLSDNGIEFGVRAANHRDQRELPVQISSLPTERHRVIKQQVWDVHGAGNGNKVLALVDEAHLNASDTAQEILGRHHAQGGVYVGVTATPIDLGHLYDSLVVAGTPSELRRCGALVPAHHYGPDEPDMKDFKASVKTGEYAERDVRKAIMTKCIFGRVWEWWEKLNPEQRPSLLFAPGVAESIWFTEQFHAKGIPWAHMDGANVWLDGDLYPTSQDLRDEVIGRLRDGTIKGISNRFVLREGVDIKEASHGIFATVMGSLQTWLQSAGRLLRAAPGKQRATFQDHGGMWWRHGSANMDRKWELTYTENIIAGMRSEQFRDKQQAEPIHCPKCGQIRASGDTCSGCGQRCNRKSRVVIQQDGTLKEQDGDIHKPRRVSMRSDTERLWEQCYYRAKNSKNHMTFRQAEALFFRENYYYPPRNLPLMPTNDLDWFQHVRDVPRDRLSGDQQ